MCSLVVCRLTGRAADTVGNQLGEPRTYALSSDLLIVRVDQTNWAFRNVIKMRIRRNLEGDTRVSLEHMKFIIC